MHIERGDLRVVLDLLDAHSIQLTNLSGTTVIEALLAAKKVHGLDIGPVLKKVETLKMQNKDAT